MILPWHAFLTGLVGGMMYYFSRLLLWRVRVDDPCVAISVHGFPVPVDSD